jgi:hypothetical protein
VTLGLLSLLGVVRHGVVFACMWLAYLSLYLVGQTFYSFQW